MAVIDYLRTRVSCVLCTLNLLLLLLCRALCLARCALDSTQKNLEAMKRQVKGLQAEYERVTTVPGGGAGGDGGAEVAALKKQVDKMILEKDVLQVRQAGSWSISCLVGYSRGLSALCYCCCCC